MRADHRYRLTALFQTQPGWPHMRGWHQHFLSCIQPHQRNQGATKKHWCWTHAEMKESARSLRCKHQPLERVFMHEYFFNRRSCMFLKKGRNTKPLQSRSESLLIVVFSFFFHFVVQLISLYYLMAVPLRVLSQQSSVLIRRFEESTRTSGFV